MMGKNTLEETDYRDGKAISVAKMVVAPDGKTMKLMVDDKLRGTKSEFTRDETVVHFRLLPTLCSQGVGVPDESPAIPRRERLFLNADLAKVLRKLCRRSSPSPALPGAWHPGLTAF